MTSVPAATIRRLAASSWTTPGSAATITLDGYEFPFRPVVIKSERGALSNKVGRLPAPGGQDGRRPGRRPRRARAAIWPPTPGRRSAPGPTASSSRRPRRPATSGSYPPSIDLKEFYPHRHTSPFLAWKAILDPEKYGIDYAIDVLLTYAANPIMGSVNPDEAIEAFKRIPFIATIPLVYDEMAQFADILLPESVIVERHALIEFGHHVVQAADDPMLRVKGVLVQKPVIPPLYDTRQADDIYIDLAERVGFLYGEGGLNDQLNAQLALAGEHALDLRRKYTTPATHGPHPRAATTARTTAWTGSTSHSVYPACCRRRRRTTSTTIPGAPPATPSTSSGCWRPGARLKAHLAEVGLDTVPGQDPDDIWQHYQAIPRWCGRPDDGVAPEFDLYAINWSTPQWRMSAGDQVGNVWVQEFVAVNDPYEYRILINTERPGEGAHRRRPGDAWRPGMAAGPRARLKLTELMFPEALGFPATTASSRASGTPSPARGHTTTNCSRVTREPSTRSPPASTGAPRVKISQGEALMRYGMVIDLSKCTGCGRLRDRLQSRRTPPRRASSGAAYTSTKPATYPSVRLRALPTLCMQCDEPACEKACPTGATWVRSGGIVLVDNEQCIGCAYCVWACPYQCTVAQPGRPAAVQPGVRIRLPSSGPGTSSMPMASSRSVTSARRASTTGWSPACVTTCPSTARTFGDLDDPDSDVSRLIAASKGGRAGSRSWGPSPRCSTCT